MLQPNQAAQRTFGPSANQFVRDMTESDLSSHLGPVGSRGGMYIQFFWDKIRIENESDPVLNGTYQTRLCIAKCPKGDNRTIAHRFITEDQAKQMYPAEYAAFSQSEAIPTNGTPLHELPGISTSQIARLTLYNLRSIEDVAEAPQEIINPMGMDGMSAHTLAKRWVANKTANADLINTSQRDAVTTAELERLQASDAANRQTIAALEAKLDLLMKMGVGAGAPMPQNAAPQPSMQPMPSTSPSLLPDMLPDSALFSGGGGSAMGNDDLMDGAPTAADPLGIKRKAR